MKKSEEKSRLVTYVDKKTLGWIKKSAEKMGLNESAFLRLLIKKEMDEMDTLPFCESTRIENQKASDKKWAGK